MNASPQLIRRKLWLVECGGTGFSTSRFKPLLQQLKMYVATISGDLDEVSLAVKKRLDASGSEKFTIITATYLGDVNVVESIIDLDVPPTPIKLYPENSFPGGEA